MNFFDIVKDNLRNLVKNNSDKNNYYNEIIGTDKNRILKTNGLLNEITVSFSRHYHLFILLKGIVNILNKNKIQYFIASGLLLGLFRHKNSFIPWDDDVDIYIFDKDENKLKTLFDNNYTSLLHTKTSLMICEKDYSRNSPFIEIFLLKKNNLNQIMYILSNQISFEYFPQDCFYEKQLFPLKKKKLILYLPDGKIFNSFYVNIPYNSIEYLNRAYPNWKTEYIYSGTHTKFYKSFRHFTKEKNC